MARQQHGQTEIISQTTNQPSRLLYALRIESVRGLVENDNFGRWQQRLRDAEALPHAVRINSYRIARAFAQVYDFEHLFDALLSRAARQRSQQLQVTASGKVLVECG